MASVNPYSAPRSSVSSPLDSGYGEVKILSLRGRIGRMRYLAYYGGVNLLVMLAYFIIGGVLFGIGQQLPLDPEAGRQLGVGVAVTLMVLMLITIPVFVTTTVQRLHDLGASGWWLLMLFVPLANLVTMLLLLLLRGQPGPNRFGRRPPPNTLAVKLIAWLLIAAGAGTLALTWYASRLYGVGPAGLF